MLPIDTTIASLERALKEARARKQKIIDRQKESVPVLWQFIIEPVEDDRFNGPLPNGYLTYKLSGEVSNREEAEAVGHHVSQGGAMRYLWNESERQLICGLGGGTYFASGIKFLEDVSQFIRDNPEGGDITHIVNIHRKS